PSDYRADRTPRGRSSRDDCSPLLKLLGIPCLYSLLTTRRMIRPPVMGWSGRAPDRCPWCIVSKSSLHSAVSTATEPVHDHPTRLLQLRAASSYDRGRTIAHLHVPLPGVPTPHWRRDQQPGALPPRAGHLRR